MAASSSAPVAAAVATAASGAPLRSSRLIRRVPFFYGWVVLGVGTLGIVMMGPSQSYTVSLFLDHFVQDLGISRATASLIYGIATLTASLLLPLTGRLVDRYGTRRLIALNALVFGLALMAMSQVSGPWTLLVGLLLVRYLGFGSMQLISNNAIAQWFILRRGLVMGVAGQSLAISLLFFPWLSNQLINDLGWRQAWVALGALSLVVMLPVGWFFFRDRPELYGLTPDGRAPRPAEQAALAQEDHWTLAEARRTAVFWLFAAACSAISLIAAGMVFHQTSLFVEHGLDRSLTVTAFQISALASIVGNLGMGYLLDRYSPRHLLAAQMALMLGAMVQLHFLAAPRDVVTYSILMGLTTGSYRVMDATVWAKYFGRHHLGSIRGATMIGTVGGTALGAYPLGLSFDLTGSYAPALLMLAALPILIIVASIIIRRPPQRPPAATVKARGDEAAPTLPGVQL
jgi:MFS family permease